MENEKLIRENQKTINKTSQMRADISPSPFRRGLAHAPGLLTFLY
jgi:hypothetical protein